MQVLDRRSELDLDVIAISFAAPDMLRRYRRHPELAGLRLFTDPQRAAYRAFGFERASVARVWLHPRVWLTYASLIARGRRPEPAHDDTLQLGGDVLVMDGAVRWIHRSRGPEDRPTVARILAAREAHG